MVFIYIYTLSKQRWHFSLRESKAHIAIDIFTLIKKTLMKEYAQAGSNASASSYILICYFCKSVS